MAYLARRPARHEQLVVRGVPHRITRWGPPGDTPLVLLHGFMDCADTWQFLVDELPDDWPLAAPDWRGFGGSAWQADGYWFPDYLADLDALLDALAPAGPARLIGHSMGGNVAGLYAGVRPERIEWLVNLEGFGLPRTTSSAAPERYGQWLDELARAPRRRTYDSPHALAAILVKRNPRLSPDRAAFIARAWTRPCDAGYELALDPRHRLVNPVLYRRDEAEACWSRSTAPVLLVLGEHSESRAALGADGTDESLRRLYPDIALTTLEGVGHMMHHEDPAAVAREIVQWRAGHEGGPQPASAASRPVSEAAIGIRWHWRAFAENHPINLTYKWVRRIAITIVGFSVLIVGVAMTVLPGPAFVVIPVGLTILGLEFAWARRWVKMARERAEIVSRSVLSRAPRWWRRG